MVPAHGTRNPRSQECRMVHTTSFVSSHCRRATMLGTGVFGSVYTPRFVFWQGRFMHMPVNTAVRALFRSPGTRQGLTFRGVVLAGRCVHFYKLQAVQPVTQLRRFWTHRRGWVHA